MHSGSHFQEKNWSKVLQQTDKQLNVFSVINMQIHFFYYEIQV